MADYINLVPKWSDADLAKFNTWFTNAVNMTDGALLEGLQSNFRDLFCTFKIEGRNPLEESTYFKALDYTSNHYIKDRLNSIKTVEGNLDYAPFYYPILFEIENPVGSGRWRPIEAQIGLEQWDDGTIFAPALADNKLSWGWKTTPWAVTGGQLQYEVYNIRFTAVVYGDHAGVAVVNQEGVKTKLKSYSPLWRDSVNFNPDIDRFTDSFNRTGYIKSDIYHYWYRDSSSKPIPQSIYDRNVAAGISMQGFSTTTIRDDISTAGLDYAKRSQWDSGCLGKEGQLVYNGQMAQVNIGECVSNISGGDRSIKANAVKSSVLYECNREGTIKTTVYLS